MKVRSKILAAFCALASLCVPAEGFDLSGRHVLPNGLEVRLIPRPSTPLVAVLVFVKTGYALEDSSNRGYSHLLEHLVFAGTKKMDKEALFREIESMGAYLNGYTRDDYMGYLLVGHRDHASRQMELLSEILFGAALKKKAVTEAREVVIEEIRQRRSRPGVRAEEMFQALLYEGSSYARTGLGNERTVSEVSREEILAHYRRVYRPDNMILVAAGGLDERKFLDILGETFGRAEPGAETVRPEPPRDLGARRAYTLAADTPDLRIRIGFNGPDPRSEDAEALELLAAVLGGPAGRLRKALEAGGFNARSVSAGLSINSGFSRFVVSAGFPAETSGGEALESILSEIDTVTAAGPTPEEVRTARDALVAGEVMRREKLHYYLMEKAPWILAGAPGQGFSEARWDGVNDATLQSVAAAYLTGRPSLSLIAEPVGGEGEAAADTPAEVQREVLDNGLTLVAEQRAGSGVFALNLMTRRRSAVEPPGKAGIADFLHRMLPRGTEQRSREQVEEELRELGASLSTAGNPTVPFGDFYTSRMYSYVRLECLIEKAEGALDLVTEMVRGGSFPGEEVEEVRKQMTDYISYRESRPGALASRLLAEALYGPGPLGRDVLGEEGSIRSITREDLLRFRDRYLTGRNLVVSVVSSLPAGEALTLLRDRFSSLPAGEAVPAVSLEATVRDGLTEEELGKPQGALKAGAVLGPPDGNERAALAVVTGLLNDRLSRELREREGLAYSVGGSLGEVDGNVVFSLSMGTSSEKMDQARRGIRREIEAVRKGKVTGEELGRRVNAITGRLQMRMLSSLNRGFYLALAERNGLPHSFGEDYRQILLSLTPAQVEKAARTLLPVVLEEVIVR